MSRPLFEHSITDATAAASGDAMETGGRITIGLWVTATADPAGGLDVELEVSMDGTNWTSFFNAAGNQEGILNGTDFVDPDGNGTYAGFVTAHGVAARYVRARISTHAGGTVNAWVTASSNSQTSKDYREVV